MVIASMTKNKGLICDSRFAVRNWRLNLHITFSVCGHFLVLARPFLKL
jgi:hypothetical protein